MKKFFYAKLICNIIQKNYNSEYGVITMNNKYVWWAYKKGYVRILSATQQEWTEKGLKWFRSIRESITGATNRETEILRKFVFSFQDNYSISYTTEKLQKQGFSISEIKFAENIILK